MLDYFHLEPMRYWSPDIELGIEADIIENPQKYNQYIASQKKDGEWSRIIWDGNEVAITSRSISKKTGEYARKEKSLPHLVKEFEKLPANTVLIGELCYDELDRRSKDVGSILRSLTDLAIEKQKSEKDKLHFYLFDVLCFNNKDMIDEPIENRIKYFSEVKKYLDNKYIRYAKYMSVEEAAKEYDSYLQAGGEGFVLQKKTCKYYAGKRPAWQTIKLKKVTQEIELPVVGIIEPEMEYTGKELATWEYFKNNIPVTKYYYKGWKAGVMVNNNGVICRVASGINDDDAQWLATQEAQEMIKNGQLIAKVQAMEIEKDTGKLRHPRLLQLRTDL